MMEGTFAGSSPVTQSKRVRISSDGKRHYYSKIFRSTSSWLFHNNGDGTFTDVSKESGIAASLGKAESPPMNNDGRWTVRRQ
jgi:hypothetical protein